MPRVDLNNVRKISLRELPIDAQTSPAVVKFIKMQTKMRELDLTGTQLTQHDISQLILGLIKGEIKLIKLMLSENSRINDEIVKDLQLIFSQKSTLDELYLDKTNITV